MPIENPDEVKKTGEIVQQTPFFITSNVIVAGTIKVKHAMIDESLLLLGFVVEDECLNENDFKVLGMTIKYKIDDDYDAYNTIIYPKIIIDRKSNHSSKYFGNERLLYSFSNGQRYGYLKDGNYYNGVDLKSLWNFGTSFNFYMFNDLAATIPDTAANNIMALCKYQKDGKFKYAICNLHELTPVIQ